MKCVSEKRGDMREVEMSLLDVNVLKDISGLGNTEVKESVSYMTSGQAGHSIIHPLPPQVHLFLLIKTIQARYLKRSLRYF